MKMVIILTLSKCVTIYSLKGNTSAILDEFNLDGFDVCKMLKEDPREHWQNHDFIMIGSATYYKEGVTPPTPPYYFQKYEQDLLQLENKEIVLFGSGKKEYPIFCGALDYLYGVLKDKNDIKLVYKVDQIPRKHQKIEFRDLVEEIINGR
ncbi:hypothetical protein [Metabacillus fastidiosus]|uniref:hypothetical protein n=1 Tax=Metabacillus fastidiosus TaxID=1458 RepID=UPI003D2B3353